MPKLSRSFINKQPVPDKRTYLWDEAVKGFGLHLTPAGTRSFIYQYRTASGTSRRMKIGNYPSVTPDTARDVAIDLANRIAKGEDPASERASKKNASTFNEFSRMYMEQHAKLHKKRKSFEEDERILKRNLLPVLGHKKLEDISNKDISNIHRKLKAKPYQANRVLSLLKKMFNISEDWGLRPVHSNPCRSIRPYKEHKRQRFMSASEIEKLGQAIATLEKDQKISIYSAAAIKILILTGARKSEILNLKWEYVGFESMALNLPDSKTGAKTIFLSEPAKEILAKLPRLKNNPFVFAGQREGRPLTDIKRPWRLLMEASGLEDLRIHDLRHSFAGVAASSGQSLLMIGKLLGHSQVQTTARYAHLAADPVKLANQQISEAIATSLMGQRK